MANIFGGCFSTTFKKQSKKKKHQLLVSSCAPITSGQILRDATEIKNPRMSWISLFFLAAFLILAGSEIWAQNSPAPSLASSLKTSDEKMPVYFNGDYLEYLEDSKFLKARGHVQLTYKGITLTADEMTCNLINGDITANGHILLQEKGSNISGESMNYNIKKESGIGQAIRIESKPWYAQGKSIDKASEKDITIHDGYFTTCDLEKPHYRLVTKKIAFVIDDKIEAWDVFVYIFDIPVFYIPYFSHYFKNNRKPPFMVQVGQNDIGGDYIKTTYFYSLSPEWSGSVSNDYFSKKGWGKGLGLEYDDPSVQAKTEGYQIWENGDYSQSRWLADGSYAQTFFKENRLVGSFEDYSDGEFDKDYNTDFINHQQRTYVAVSQNTASYSTSLSVEKDNTWNTNASPPDYETSLDTLPELDFNLLPVGLANTPWYFSLASQVKRSRTALVTTPTYLLDDYVLEESLSPTLQGGFKVSPFVQWNTSLGLTQNYRDHPQISLFAGGGGTTQFEQNVSGLNGSYSLSNGLTTYHAPFLRSDLNHTYSGSFYADPMDPYQGILQNYLSGSLQYQFQSLILAKLGTGYDFKSLANNTLNKFDLLSLEVSANTADNILSAYVNSRFNMYWEYLQDSHQGVSLHDPKRTSEIQLGLEYQNNSIPPVSYFDVAGPLPAFQPQPDLWDLYSQLSFTLPVLGKFRLSDYYDMNSGTVVAQEYSLVFPMHCWEAYFTWRNVGQTTSIAFSLGLTAFPQSNSAFATRSIGQNY